MNVKMCPCESRAPTSLFQGLSTETSGCLVLTSTHSSSPGPALDFAVIVCMCLCGDRLHMPGNLDFIKTLIHISACNSNKQLWDFQRSCTGGP